MALIKHLQMIAKQWFKKTYNGAWLLGVVQYLLCNEEPTYLVIMLKPIKCS